VHAGSTSGIRVNPDTSLSTSALDAGKPGSLEAIAAQLAALSQQLGTFTNAAECVFEWKTGEPW